MECKLKPCSFSIARVIIKEYFNTAKMVLSPQVEEDDVMMHPERLIPLLITFHPAFDYEKKRVVLILSFV